MKGRERKKSSNSSILSRGVVILVLLMLAAQFGYFIYYIVCDLREEPQETVMPTVVKDTADFKDDSVAEQKVIPVEEHTYAKKHTAPEKRPEKPADNNKDSYIYDGWKWDMVELNSADSAALDGLPGIGPYYARQILRYREKLWGRYHDIHQIMEIRGIDTTLFRKIKDRIYIAEGSIIRYDLYTLSIDSLTSHPYIGPYMAKGIERLRSMTPREDFSIKTLVDNRIVDTRQAERMALYFE